MTAVIASEWTKVRSVKSTFWLLAIAAVTAVGGSVIVAISDRSTDQAPPLDPVASLFLAWLEYPVLAVGIFGVLCLTSEYSTGQFRTTVAAVPQRLAVLGAKSAVVGAVVLVFGEVIAFSSFLVSEAIAAGHPGATSLARSGVALEVLAAGFCLFAIAILGVGLGAIVRSTAGAVATLPAVLYVPLAILTLPHPWNHLLGKYTFLMSAYQLVSQHSHADLLPRALALVVVVAWPAAALAVGAALIKRRDA